jgi:agmatine deiminase
MTPPAVHGYAMPAEWTRHSRCWIAWPCWKVLGPSRLAAARRATAEIARAVAEFEPVTMIVPPAHRDDPAAQCGGAVDVMEIDIDDAWTRDTGPTFVTDGTGQLAGCDWRFNAWGGGKQSHLRDAVLAKTVLKKLNLRRFAAPFVLEGGAIHVDGNGTSLTTETVLLNENRNPAMDRAAMEEALSGWLGVRRVIWLPYGADGDETDGHVDNVACFVRPGSVLALTCDDPDSPNHDRLAANLAVLRKVDPPFEIHTVKMARRRPVGQQILSYVNFYIANGGIVMPSFDDPADDAARDVIAALFPDRRVVQIPALDLCWCGGGIHCITQQQPAV